MLRDYGDPTQSASNPISVVSIDTGRSVSLGTGDQVAGDPVAEGVFAALTAPPRASAAVLTGNPDARVVLRDAGRPQAVLATAGTLSHAVGLARSLPVSLAVYPAPRGTEVAVTVRPAAGGSDGGLVILSRSGRIIKRLPARSAAGPALGAPVWSVSGRALAYLSASSSGAPALSVWSGGGRISIHPLPSSAGRYGTCVWSPDGRSVLCPAASGSEWVVVPAAGGPPAVARGPGLSRGVAAMIRLAAVVRGMLQRGGTTVMILAVALVATAAAAAGPIYYQAARTSILRDTVAGAGFSGRGYEANETGALPGLLGQLAPAVRSQLDHGLGSLAGRGCSPRPSRRSRPP